MVQINTYLQVPYRPGSSESVKEMAEVLETEPEMGNGMQVHSSFHTDVNELEYKDLLTSTFTQADHERGIKTGKSKDSYPQCVFCTHRYRYSVEAVECHMDPTINKSSTGKERIVRACAASQSTALGPRRARFLLVQAKIRVKMQRDKTALLEAADAERKRKLEYKDLLMSTFTQTDHDRGIKTWGAAKEGYPQCVFCAHRYRKEEYTCIPSPSVCTFSTMHRISCTLSTIP